MRNKPKRKENCKMNYVGIDADKRYSVYASQGEQDRRLCGVQIEGKLGPRPLLNICQSLGTPLPDCDCGLLELWRDLRPAGSVTSE